MKKLLILIFLIFLSGCGYQPHGITNYQDLDEILEKRAIGKYDEAIVYDLRDGECFNGHIPGFTCIFYQTGLTIDDVYNNIKKVYSKQALVIFICEDGMTSKTLANKLSKDGYKKVYYFEGGYLGYTNQKENFTPEVGCDC